jgi:23S rRNA (cytidine1920-2'-O)/16S rRNA (cytidine1409-2'-O)-methyltransferase
MPPRTRLDEILVLRGLCASRSRAQALIAEGKVLVDGRVASRKSALVPPDAAIELSAGTYVSRGAAKLLAALDRFRVDPRGRVALDAGASTGGFTQVLLERGAARVYAVDAGHDQLDPGLRADPRVVVHEGTNLRLLRRGDLPEAIELFTLDLSFISLRLVLPAVASMAKEGAEVVALVKPQFEAGPRDVGKGGIVRDRTVHLRVLAEVAQAAGENGFTPLGVCPSPILGGDGNREYLMHLGTGTPDFDAAAAVEEAFA